MSDSSIKVAIKVRPLIKRESEENLPIQWAVQGNKIVPTDPDLKKRGDGGFQFDHIFDTVVKNDEVFNTVVKPIVDASVNGFNGTVFAYGQTSSGKTYTMMGNHNEPGIIPLTVKYMFEAISDTVGREFLLRVSYLEIYNEKVNDLLNKDTVDIKLYEDTTGQVIVKCKEEVTNSPENVLSIMKKGDKNRRTGETNMNDRSSRSHTIFRITIESREASDASSDGAIQVSQLNLVDLAGSERVRQTGATGERFKEGLHINLSLSTLALVIKQLSESQDTQKFANFRDSKLTRLLQASLGGNTMTTIICAVTPAALEETQCTLSFACRARNIKNKPQVNEVMSDAALLKRYAKQLEKLNAELEKVKQENRAAEVEEMASKLLEKDQINQSLEQRIELLQTRIVSSSNTRHEESFRRRSCRRRTWGGPSTFKPNMTLFKPCNDLSSLPTIKEMSPEQCRRNSVAPVDIMNDSFQIAFTDFELELIESERDREASGASEDGSDSEEEKPIKCVRFKTTIDNVSNYRPTYDNHSMTTETKIEPNQAIHCQQQSPDTPKIIMRETIRSLRRNFVELSEFTTLEKQMNCEDYQLREVAKLQVENAVLNAKNTNFQCTITELRKQLDQLRKDKVGEKIETSSKCAEDAVESAAEASNCVGHMHSCKCEEQQIRIRTLESQVESFMAEKIIHERTAEELLLGSKKIHDLEKELTELTSEKGALQNALVLQREIGLQDHLEKIANLEQRMVDVTKEKAKFQQTALDLNGKLEELGILYESDRKTHERKILDLEKLVDESASQKVEFERQNATLVEKERRLQTSLEEVSKLENQIACLTADKIKCENKSFQLDKELKVARRENETLKEEQAYEAGLIQEKMEQFNAEKLQFEHNTTDLRDKLMEAARGMTRYVEEAKCKLRDELEEVNSRNKTIAEEHMNEMSKLRAELEELESQNTEHEHNISALRKKYEENGLSSAESMEKLICELRDKLEEANLRNRTIAAEQESETSKFREQLECLETEKLEYERVLADVRRKQEETNHSIAEYVEVTKSLRSTLEEVNRKNQAIKEEQLNETSKLRQQITNLMSEKLQCECALNDLREKLEKLTPTNIECTQEAISDLQNQLEKANQQNQLLKEEQINEMSKLQEQIEKRESEKLQYERTLSDLHEQLKEVTESNIGLRSELDEANRQNKMMNEEITNEGTKLQAQIKLLESEIMQRECSLNDLREQLEKGKQSNAESEEEAVNNLTHELVAAKRELEVAKEERSNETSKLHEEIMRLTAEQVQYERIVTDLRSALEEVTQSKVKSLEKKMSGLQHELEEVNQQNRILQEERLSEVSMLQEQIKYLDSGKEQYEHVLTDLREKLEQAEEQNVMTQQMHTKKILELQSRHEYLSAQQEQSEPVKFESIANLENERTNGPSSLEEKIESEGTIVCELQKRLEETESQGELVRKKLREVIFDLHAQLESIDCAGAGLSADLTVVECKGCNESREREGKLICKIDGVKRTVTELCLLLEKVLVKNTLLLRNQTESPSELRTVVPLKQEVVNNSDESVLKNLEHENQIIRDEMLIKSSKILNTDINLTLQQLSFDSIVSSIRSALKDSLLSTKVLRNNGIEVLGNDVCKKIHEAAMQAMLQLHEHAEDAQQDSLKNDKLDETLKAKSEQQNFSELANKIPAPSSEQHSVELSVHTQETATELRAKDNVGQTCAVDTSKLIHGSVIHDLMSIKVSLEEDNAKLATNLDLKIQELDEIKNDVQGLTLDIKQLEKTIMLLTTENMEMSTKLSAEKDRTRHLECDYQKRIDDLYARISTVAEEKINLEHNLTSLNELVDTLRSKTPEANDDDIKQKLSEYQGRIETLMTENIDLLEKLTQKSKELEEIKQSKSLLYDHECIYKDKMERIAEKNRELEEENIKHSNNLIEMIQENDGMAEELTILKGKIETLMDTKATENTLTSNANQLQAEIVELKANVRFLTEENIKMSKNLMETMDNMDDLDNSRNLNNNKFHFSLLFGDNMSDIATFSHNDELPESMSRTAMQEEIEYLRCLNQKLSEIKLTPCTECIHLKEVNKCHRDAKIQVKSLTHRLEDLQRKFNRQSADAGILMKVNKDFNDSLCDSSLNSSQWDALNVTFVEEKVQSLNKELKTVRDNQNKLTNLYKKCDEEVGKLDAGTTVESTDIPESNIDSKTEKRSSKSVRIEKIESDMNDIRFSINELKGKFEDIRSVSDSYINERESLLSEINALKAVRDELQLKISENELFIATATERADILDSEVTSLTAKIKQFNAAEKKVHNEKLLLEVELDNLKAEKEKKEITLTSVTQKFEAVTKQKMELANSKDIMEHRHKEELNSALKKYQDSVMESESNLKITEEKLNECKSDNDAFKQEIVKLRNMVQDLKDKEESMRKSLESDARSEIVKKLSEELTRARGRIIKEFTPLRSKRDNLNSQDIPVDELFAMFLQAILQKESEIIKVIRTDNEKSKQKLEDQKQQSVDAMKRTTLWAKELENEIEKLQNDIAMQEGVCRNLREKISQLEHLLKESNRENAILREKMESIETDFNNLQAELEKKSSVEIRRDETLTDPQRHQRLVQEAVTGKELELQSSITSMKEEYERQITDLSSTIETYKMENKELKNNVDGLEENEKHLKNIINMKSCELSKSARDMQNLMTEWERLTVTHNEACRDLESKNAQLLEMSSDFKSKCDLLSEYKMKLDIVTPEYESLKEQAKERRLNLERYKRDMETLKAESEMEKVTLQDKLNAEEINRAGSEKLLTALTTKNKALLAELDALQQKNEELGLAIAKLERKIRNSTSKQKADTKIEDLEDRNRVLQCNLDGATNRIGELQALKNRLLQKQVELEGQHEIVSRENDELKQAVESYKLKANDTNVIELQGKYHETIQTKNQLALELEAKKLLLIQRDNELKAYESQVKQLTEKNTELDTELEEMAEVIREKDGENAVLEDKLNTCFHENAELKASRDGMVNVSKNELENKVRALVEENRIYQSDLASLCNNGKDVDVRRLNEKLRKDIAQLKKENAELLGKVVDLESMLEMKNSTSSSKSTSPAFQTNRRRRSRGDAFNERRHLEEVLDGENEVANNSDSIDVLRKKVQELEREIVCKNGKLATLEMQIQSENFPYEKKCKELTEHILAYRKKNAELCSTITNLERAMNNISRRECDECRRRSTNQKHQHVQTIPVKQHCTDMCTGELDDKVRKKLEHDKKTWRDLCRTASRRIKDLEKRLKEFETIEDPPASQEIHPLRDNNALRQSSATSSTFAEKGNIDFDRKTKQWCKHCKSEVGETLRFRVITITLNSDVNQ